MGYDIYAVKPPGALDEIEAKLDEWRRLTDEARAEGAGSLYESDQATAKAALAALDEADRLRGYFRLNVSGMGRASGELLRAGVMVDADHTPFPDHTCGRYSDDDCATCTAWTSQNADGPGIPLFKVGSNDGWLIHPLEITSGIAVADRRDPGWRAALTDYVRDFVEYLEGVANTGGCRVH